MTLNAAGKYSTSTLAGRKSEANCAFLSLLALTICSPATAQTGPGRFVPTEVFPIEFAMGAMTEQRTAPIFAGDSQKANAEQTIINDLVEEIVSERCGRFESSTVYVITAKWKSRRPCCFLTDVVAEEVELRYLLPATGYPTLLSQQFSLTSDNLVGFGEVMVGTFRIDLPVRQAFRFLINLRGSVVKLAAVSFQAIHSGLGSNSGPNGGLSIFPEKTSPNDTVNRRTVSIRATVSPPRPLVPVYFRSFDVDDPSSDDVAVDETGPEGNDNRYDGSVPPQGWMNMLLALTGPDGTASVVLTVSAQPGNNYRGVANVDQANWQKVRLRPGNGRIIEDHTGTALDTECARQTEMLTVWRTLHVEIDTMAPIPAQVNTVTGNLSGALGLPSATPRLYLGQNLGAGQPFGRAGLLNRFEGGSITIAGKGTFTVRESTAGAIGIDSVVINGPSTPDGILDAYFVLHDDDLLHGFGTGAAIPPPDTSRLAPGLSPAYIDVWIGDLPNPQPLVPFLLNISGDGSTDLTPNYRFDNKATRASDEFWTIYLLGAFQHTVTEDGDPDDSSLSNDEWKNAAGDILVTRGIVDGIPGIGAHIYKEATNEGTSAEANVVLHEVGHLLGAEHGDGGLMDSTAVPDFTARSLGKIRSVIRSEGVKGDCN